MHYWVVEESDLTIHSNCEHVEYDTILVVEESDLTIHSNFPTYYFFTNL